MHQFTLLHKIDHGFCLVYQRSTKVSFNSKGRGFICLNGHSQFITLYFDSLTLCIIYTPAQLLFTSLSEIQQKFFQWKRAWFYLLRWPHSMDLSIGLCLLLKTGLGVGFVLFQICCCTVTPIKAVLGNRSQFKAIVTLIEKQEQLFFGINMQYSALHSTQCRVAYNKVSHGLLVLGFHAKTEQHQRVALYSTMTENAKY